MFSIWAQYKYLSPDLLNILFEVNRDDEMEGGDVGDEDKMADIDEGDGDCDMGGSYST